MQGVKGTRSPPPPDDEGFLSFWSLKLHSPRGDVEHGRVESLASEGRAFSIPPLLQHLMDFLQTENREIKGDHRVPHAFSYNRLPGGTEPSCFLRT